MKTVHFILTSGTLTPDYRRAIVSAKVHEAPIVVWHVGEKPDARGLDITLEKVDVPEWLLGQNAAHTYDALAYKIACEHGGLILGLDTISLRPAWDLLGDKEVVLSTDWPERDWLAWPDHFNNNFLARQGSRGAWLLYSEARTRILGTIAPRWGFTGPELLTEFVKTRPDQIAGAPYPALCGWSPGYIWRFYLGVERPDPETRVIHLCKTAYIHLYEKRYDQWARQYPLYAGPVERRTDLNADLLAFPD